ncbi:putative RNA polymerase I subunit [Cavenderia fasciculata]|uniref:RNA polymerase I subunit n=1 Tax=Cavenderia fasciculata TaxID=261658 RepID=F4QE69_CACFS|nr:putative RNA polymerase I subunit [Cavenderia fasciculata]EGG14016.1 putative RNA polymerase I subunit [Cavenderia fasciculata]|eukprot:XP_004350724.1 putative RNA polymerase I subunit [Cavenderia fasciculata]
MAPSTNDKRQLSFQVKEDSGDCSPCVLNFHGGLPSLNFLEDKDTSFQSLNNRAKKIYVICRYNETTGKVQVVPIDEILQVNQSINDYEEKFDTVDRSTMSYLDKEKSLANSFGSRITKKTIHKTESENLGSLDSSKTKQMADNVKNELVSQGASMEDQTTDLPQYNLEATEAKDIYAIEILLPFDVYSELDVSDSMAFCKDKSTIPETLPSYVKQKIEKISGIEDNEDKEHACKILLIIYYMSLMAKARKGKDIFTVLSENGVPRETKHYLLNNFCTKVSKTKNTMSSFQTNKLYNFVAILSLHLDGFYSRSESINELAKALGIEPHILTKHYQRVGCTTIRDPQRKSFIDFRLKAPLKITEEVRQFKKKKF